MLCVLASCGFDLGWLGSVLSDKSESVWSADENSGKDRMIFGLSVIDPLYLLASWTEAHRVVTTLAFRGCGACFHGIYAC